MSEINTLDLKAFIYNAITEVFNTMLSMEVEPLDTDLKESKDGAKIVGSVSFAGDVMGSIEIQISNTFARIMTAAMLGMELEDVEGEADVYDVIGEFSNIIGGDLKSRLCDSGFPCELSIPSITRGSDFEIEPMGWTRHERFAFRHQEHTALVKVFIRPGN